MNSYNTKKHDNCVLNNCIARLLLDETIKIVLYISRLSHTLGFTCQGSVTAVFTVLCPVPSGHWWPVQGVSWRRAWWGGFVLASAGASLRPWAAAVRETVRLMSVTQCRTGMSFVQLIEETQDRPYWPQRLFWSGSSRHGCSAAGAPGSHGSWHPGSDGMKSDWKCEKNK